MRKLKIDYNCPSKRLIEKDNGIRINISGGEFEAVFEEVAPGVWEEVIVEKNGD